MSRPRIGVSACLLGQPVRYDGASKADAYITDTLAQQAELIAICPETGAGLAVPRPALQLVRNQGWVDIRGVADASLCVTGRILDWCRQQQALLASLDGLIVKSRSPSCGLGSTPLWSPAGEQLGLGDGLWAAHVRQAFPHLPVVEEQQARQLLVWLRR